MFTVSPATESTVSSLSKQFSAHTQSTFEAIAERQRAISRNDAITKQLSTRNHEIDDERLHCEWKALPITERIDNSVAHCERAKVL